MRALRALAVLAACALSAGGACAQTSTGTFNLQLTVNAQCVLLAETDLNFGTARAFTANLDQATTLSVQCTKGTPFNVGLTPGLHSSSADRRTLKSGTTKDAVNYQLYRDAARSQVWGSNVGVDTYSASGTGDPQNVTVYGRIPTQNAVASGTYSDAITVTLSY